MNVAIFWDIALCSPYVNQRFGRTYQPSNKPVCSRWLGTHYTEDDNINGLFFVQSEMVETEQEWPMRWVGRPIQQQGQYAKEIRSIGFCQWYINITITILNIICCPVFYLKHGVLCRCLKQRHINKIYRFVHILQETHYVSASSRQVNATSIYRFVMMAY
jgi:hypothetical protein